GVVAVAVAQKDVADFLRVDAGRPGRSSECKSASIATRDPSETKSLYRDSRSRSLHSEFARTACLRWVIHVVAIEAEAPTNEPTVAANAVTVVESIIHHRELYRTSDSRVRRARE